MIQSKWERMDPKRNYRDRHRNVTFTRSTLNTIVSVSAALVNEREVNFIYLLRPINIIRNHKEAKGHRGSSLHPFSLSPLLSLSRFIVRVILFMRYKRWLLLWWCKSRRSFYSNFINKLKRQVICAYIWNTLACMNMTFGFGRNDHGNANNNFWQWHHAHVFCT